MSTPARSFACAPRFDGPPDAHNPHGHDATGAFQPGMERFRDCHAAAGGVVVPHLFNNHGVARARRRDILAAFERAGAAGRFDAFVYFGHGWPGGLSSGGFDADDVPILGEAIIRLCKPDAKVVLYACSAAAPGGFAYQLGRYLGGWANHGMEVFGHPVLGHSFRNPMVRRFPSSRGETGETVAPPGQFDAWRRAMAQTTLWARFAFLTPAEISAEVLAHAVSHPAPPVHHAARPHAPAGR